MAPQGSHCPLPHEIATNRPKLGVSLLKPSPNPRPLIDLLGVNDQELQEQMAKGHPYVFNMGSGKTIAYQNYQEAAKALMERNMPEVLHDRQTKVVFMPESHLPKMPRMVDINRFEARKKMIRENVSSPPEFLKKMIKAGPGNMNVVKGDMAEQDLLEELHKFYGTAADKEVVVYQGPELRIPGIDQANDDKWYRESDVVIVNKKTKTVYNIESKTILNDRTGGKAVEQTEALKKILEEFFPEVAKNWRFVGMVYCNAINQRVCIACSPFIIHGVSEVATKLNDLDNQLKSQSVLPSHVEYVSLVQGLAFVVFAQPISTFCTITDNVVAKVKGVPGKAGQGDFQSIVFWTNEQAKIMLWDQPLVFFNGPWSTGKTLLMREKSIMWARQNQTEKLFFFVVRRDDTERASLLEMELKSFFHQQHNLQNVEVLGLPTRPKDTLTSLLKEATTRPSGSWMVDELIMPEPKDHQQWNKDLEQLQRHIGAQSRRAHLWIACAGIEKGKAEHFEWSYLTSVLPPVFHLPRMDMPLRNTKQTLAMAGLEGNTDVKGLNYYGAASTATNPVYKVPDQLMSGVEGKQFLVNNYDDADELASVVEAACKEVLKRTGGAGFPILSDGYKASKISPIKRGVERAGAEALIYHRKSNKSCSEAEVEEWLRRRRVGKEKRCLFVDEEVSRGWEASHALVVSLHGDGWENLVMRTMGHCTLVKAANIDSDSDIDSN